MPDYSKPPVYFTETKLFKDWCTEKGYAWPPRSADERARLVMECQRDGLERVAREVTISATSALIELSIDDDPPNRLFLEYERQLTRLIAEAFRINPPRPLELYIPPPSYQRPTT